MTQQPFSCSLLFITATTIQHKDNKEQYKSAHHQHVKKVTTATEGPIREFITKRGF